MILEEPHWNNKLQQYHVHTDVHFQYYMNHLCIITMHPAVKLAMMAAQHLVRLVKSPSQVIAPLCSGMGHEYLKNYEYSKSFPDYLYV